MWLGIAWVSWGPWIAKTCFISQIVPCLISWTTFPEPIANQTPPLCAMQWTGPGTLMLEWVSLVWTVHFHQGFRHGSDVTLGSTYIHQISKADSMHIAGCIASHNGVAKECLPQQCLYWSLALELANLSSTTIALEYNDEPIICSTGKQWPVVWEG